MNNQPDTWKRIESEEVANCRIFKVRQDTCVRLNDGAEHNFFVLENTDWVNIIPVTTNNEVVLIEQFRHGIEAMTLEIPGGMVDDDEDPDQKRDPLYSNPSYNNSNSNKNVGC